MHARTGTFAYTACVCWRWAYKHNCWKILASKMAAAIMRYPDPEGQARIHVASCVCLRAVSMPTPCRKSKMITNLDPGWPSQNASSRPHCQHHCPAPGPVLVAAHLSPEYSICALGTVVFYSCVILCYTLSANKESNRTFQSITVPPAQALRLSLPLLKKRLLQCVCVCGYVCI